MFDAMAISMWNLSQPLLAQSVRKGLSDQDRSEIFFWLTVLIIVAIITSAAGYMVYRKVKSGDEKTEIEQDFSLSQMRRLYEAGELSHEEYTQLRERILTATKRTMLGENEIVSQMKRHDVIQPASETAEHQPSPEMNEPPTNDSRVDEAIDHDEPPTDDDLTPPDRN